MAIAKEKIDNVNASVRAHNAAERIGSNGTMQGNLHPLRRPLSWYGRFQESLPDSVTRALPTNWEHVTVNKQVDSITMPRWIANAILIAILGFMAQSWWARSSDHDIIVTSATEIRVIQSQFAKLLLDTENDRRDAQAWREVMNGNQKKIEGMLSQQQIDALERLRKPPNQTHQQ